MTRAEWIKIFNNIEYPADEICNMRKQLDEDDVIVVYGESDDLIEFVGAINDEGGCFEDETFYINQGGLTTDSKNYIKVHHPKEGTAQFEYETNIPCEWFNILEDGCLYCRGFIFNRGDLK